MPPDGPSGARPAPVVLRIKLRYDDVETLAARFAPNVGKSGLFLPTKTLQAIGAEVKFELRLADDKVVITGLGKVRAAKAADPDQPRAAFGMAIELTRVTRESRDVILKILAKRRELGLPDVAIPMPHDIDAAKASQDNTGTGSAPSPTPIPRTIDSAPILMSSPVEATPIPAAATTIDRAPVRGGRDSSPILDSGPLRDSSPILDSGAIREHTRDSAPILDSGPVRDSSPIFESAPIPRKEPEQSRVLTAPRRASGPIAIAKVHTVSALAPEAPRKKRPALQEVIDRASGPVAAVSVNLPGLDDEVDVAAVMAMARALAGSDIDAELEALRDSASAPIEISVEAASAELARQLGGAAVRRGWAPPPPVEESRPVEAKSGGPAIGAEESVGSIGAASIDGTAETGESIDATASGERVETAESVAASTNGERVEASSGTVADDNRIVEPGPERADANAVRHAMPEPEAEPTPVAAMPDPEAEPTPVAAMPEPGVSPNAEQAAFVAASTEVEPQLDTPAAPMFSLSDEDDVPGEDHEVDPEQIADEIHQLGEDDFEEVEHTAIGAEPPEPEPELTPVYTEPSVAAAIEASLDQQLADADSEPDDLGFAQSYPAPAYGEAEPAYAESAYAEPAYAEAPHAGPATGDYNEEELEEIEDFEILAEADEEDADLLASHGEEEASGSGAVYPDRDPVPEPAPRASYDYSRHSDPDFHARLELSDEHPRAPAPDDEDEPPLHIDPRELSARQAMAAFEEPQNAYEPMHELSLGDDIPHDDFDSPHADFNKPSAYARAAPVVEGFPPLSKFDESDVHAPAPAAEPRYLRASQQPAPQPKQGEDGYDLETALEALDVDLDDLSIPHAKTERGPTIPPTNRPRTGSQRAQRASTSGRVQTRTPQRPTTDDGVLIDFDDDDD